MMKWYNIEFNIETREMLRRVEAFKEWLYDNAVKFETSAVGKSGVHFEIMLEPGSVDVVNEALDQIVWYDVIKELEYNV